MTRLMNRIVAVGALLLFGSALAFAQSEMKVEIPFDFQTHNGRMPAGVYKVTELAESQPMQFFRLKHADTGKSTVLVSAGSTQRSAAAAALPAQVNFRCAAEACAISEIFTFGTVSGHRFAAIRLHADRDEVATVRVPAAAE